MDLPPFNLLVPENIIPELNNIREQLSRANDAVTYDLRLRELLSFINKHDAIGNYVRYCGEPTINFEAEFTKSEENSVSNRNFSHFGETKEEEVANILNLLKYIVNNNLNAVQTIGRYYTESKNCRSKIIAINRQAFCVLIKHIREHLKK